MKFFDLDSPFMQIMNKIANLLLLNILTFVCCIPIVTVGASFTAMYYVVLKIVRDEDTAIIRSFWKSFKQNFRQATIIWLLFLVVGGLIFFDLFIIYNSGMQLNPILSIIALAVCVAVLSTFMFVFPVLSKFDNTIKETIKNAFITSIMQFPKTVLMVLLYLLPMAIFLMIEIFIPLVLLFGLSVPAYFSAMLYNNFFLKMEDMIREAQPKKEQEDEDESDKIFSDKLDESLFPNDKN